MEADAFETARVGESIPPDARTPLSKLGLWPAFCADGHARTVGSRALWGAATPGYNDFVVNVHGVGWHLDRRRFDGTLLRALWRAGVEVRLGARLESVEPSGSGREGIRARLRVGDGNVTLSSRVAVDATGQRALLARRMGAVRRDLDRLRFCIGRFALREDDGFPELTLLEAVRDGWWYAVRLPDQDVLVARAGDPSPGGTTEAWLTDLARSRMIAPYLQRAIFVPQSRMLRASLSFWLEPCFGPSWIAVGDAAASFDPIASQGIYKALAGGIDCADAVLGLLAGAPDAACVYARARREEFQSYRAARTYFYSLERRWPESGFWERRRGAASA